MNKQFSAAIVVAVAGLTACGDEGNSTGNAVGGDVELKTTLQHVSYGLAYNIANGFREDGIELDRAAFVKGLDDGLTGKELAVAEADLEQSMNTFQDEQLAKQAELAAAQDKMNREEGQKYLTENAKKEGVKTTQSGLQYKVVSASGSGKKPTADDTVVVHYRGTLVSGDEFDSSYSRGQPATFGVGQVIPGWTEMLQLMDVGDKVEAVIPAALAYGEHGAGERIGPNETLKFEIELIDIK